MKSRRALGLLLAIGAAACTAGTPRIEPSLVVPTEFERQPVESPTGKSERIRYLKAYEAFWYNCVTLLADDLGAQCPSTCSGTPAEVAGCSNGATEARDQIRHSVESRGETPTREALRVIAARIETQAKMATYFGERPVEEYGPR